MSAWERIRETFVSDHKEYCDSRDMLHNCGREATQIADQYLSLIVSGIREEERQKIRNMVAELKERYDTSSFEYSVPVDTLEYEIGEVWGE